MAQFTFPEFYNQPPSFTIQPTLSTKKKQLEKWGNLILDYARFTKKYDFDVNEAANSKLFNNDQIKRRLNLEGIKLVFQTLVDQGNAEWSDTKTKSRITVYWRRPEEWGQIIYKWVASNGKANSILTVWEIQNGEDAEKEEFFQLDTKILLKALQTLEKQGKATIFSTGTDENLGVKFASL